MYATGIAIYELDAQFILSLLVSSNWALMSKRRLFLLLGCVIGLVGFFVDHGFTGRNLASAQMILWSALVFGFLGIQAGETLKRPRQAGVALAVAILHFLLLREFASWFPLPSMLIGITGAAVEALMLLFLYARIGQTVDPNGPYGLTVAEVKKKRQLRKLIE